MTGSRRTGATSKKSEFLKSLVIEWQFLHPPPLANFLLRNIGLMFNGTTILPLKFLLKEIHPRKTNYITKSHHIHSLAQSPSHPYFGKNNNCMYSWFSMRSHSSLRLGSQMSRQRQVTRQIIYTQLSTSCCCFIK